MQGKKATSDLASIYYCNERIYSGRLAKHQSLRLDLVSKDHPLRVARFRPVSATAADDAEFLGWLESKRSEYRLVGRENFPMSFWVQRDLKCIEFVELYEFVPNEPRVADRPPVKR